MHNIKEAKPNAPVNPPVMQNKQARKLKFTLLILKPSCCSYFKRTVYGFAEALPIVNSEGKGLADRIRQLCR